MKKTILLGLLLPVFFTSHAHPGIGIVKDSKGNIYYTDLTQVLKIDPATGKRSVVVHHVHTHELFMDAADNLYGEHLWYNGETLDTWGHYVWRLQSNGVLDTVIRPTAGFLENYSFVRDSLGNMYWAQRFKPVSRILQSTPAGNVTTLAEGAFTTIRWLAATPGGIVYFIDLTDLYKIENGRLQLVVKNLHERTSLTGYADPDHDVYGIWPDNDANVYVAVLGGQTVKKITPAGVVRDVVHSPGRWQPCSGVFDKKSNLWLMEINAANEVRVRKVEKEALEKNPPVRANAVSKITPGVALAAVLLPVAAVFYVISKRFRRRTRRQRGLIA